MARPWVGRDSQKSRVYAAERYALTYGTEMDNPDLWVDCDKLQPYVNLIVGTSWWNQSYQPPVDGPILSRYGLAETPTTILVQFLRAGSRYQGFAPHTPIFYDGKYVPIVKFQKGWGCVPAWLILHEICHVATQNDPAHGRDFARTYLSAIETFIGEAAADLLRAGYKEHGVKYMKTNSREKVA